MVTVETHGGKVHVEVLDKRRSIWHGQGILRKTVVYEGGQVDETYFIEISKQSYNAILNARRRQDHPPAASGECNTP